MAKEGSVVKAATARALEKMRTDRKLTKSEVAERANTTYLNVYRWENGQSTPTLENLDQLAGAYGVTLVGVGRAIEQAKRVMRGEEPDGDTSQAG
jgi:transcriptional regulator with XRE-family HTH domain